MNQETFQGGSNEEPSASQPSKHTLRYRKTQNQIAKKTRCLAILGALLVAASLCTEFMGRPSIPAVVPVAEPLAEYAVQTVRIQRFLSAGNLGGAIGALQAAIALCPEAPGNYLRLADLYEHTRSYNEAIMVLEQFSSYGISAEIDERLQSLRLNQKRWIGFHESARAIEAAIDSIGEVTLDQQATVEEARAFYNKASDPAKALVKNYSVLTAAESRIAELQAEVKAAEEAAAKRVQDLIDSIDSIGDVSLSKEKKIKQIRSQYDSAPEEITAKVTNLDTLVKAEQSLKTLKELEAKREAEERAEREAARKAAEEAKKAAELQAQGEIFKLKVPYISQEGVLPTGCEIISSLMVLRYYGYSLSHSDFIDNYLTRADLTLQEDGKLYAPHPNEAFIGNPYSTGGYGCYAPVIVESLKKITGGAMQVKQGGGESLAQLTEKYVKNGTPVLVWATIGMRASTPGTQWILPNGNQFTWKRSEHCLVLVGSDNKYFYFNDPYASNGVVAYEKKLAEQRYRDMGSQSVIMQK